MVIDSLKNSHLYNSLHEGIKKAFEYLHMTDVATLPAGKYEIDGTDLFAMVQEYDTKPMSECVMEAHKKYMDVQYMVYGTEQVGHALLNGQVASKQAYSDETDFMLFPDEPSFNTIMAAGTFMIFYPGDLHMPCIQIDAPARVKKVVVKVKI
ncbi:MAG: YhcH/YjgK/YiaL family protein [Flavipsychrobacter sp.]|nr:YhcH/YjgK/YiaL family protein [Flavipsychrobacter sp.]